MALATVAAGDGQRKQSDRKERAAHRMVRTLTGQNVVQDHIDDDDLGCKQERGRQLQAAGDSKTR